MYNFFFFKTIFKEKFALTFVPSSRCLFSTYMKPHEHNFHQNLALLLMVTFDNMSHFILIIVSFSSNLLQKIHSVPISRWSLIMLCLVKCSQTLFFSNWFNFSFIEKIKCPSTIASSMSLCSIWETSYIMTCMF